MNRNSFVESLFVIIFKEIKQKYTCFVQKYKEKQSETKKTWMNRMFWIIKINLDLELRANHTFKIWNLRVKIIKKKSLYGNWIVKCVCTFKVYKKPNVLNLRFKSPPPLEARRGGQTFLFALRAYFVPPKFISVFALDLSNHLYIYLSIIFVSMYLSIHLSIYLYIYLSIYSWMTMLCLHTTTLLLNMHSYSWHEDMKKTEEKENIKNSG